MCLPAVVAGVSLAASIGGQLAQGAAARAQADAQEKAARRAREANIRAIQTIEDQTKEDAAQRIQQVRRKARATRSLAAVGAGEAGVAGVSARAVLDDIERSALEYEVGVQRQTRREIQAAEQQKVDQTEIMRNRIGGAGRGSALATGISILGAGAQFVQFEILSRPPESTETSGG